LKGEYDNILVNQTFSEQELERYSRQIILPEIGLEGQEKLKMAKVLIVGCGGLGSPLGYYLASAGVGTIGLVDYDEVGFSNLQRQIMYSTEDVGESKVSSAKKRLSSINPEVSIYTYDLKLSSENAPDILKGYDVIADGSDNFATKYLVNDACVLLKKPLVYGSVLKFDGQVSVFDSTKGPCYRCLFPEPPAAGEVPTCAEAGVLGVLPGIIGSILANEVLKLILGVGEPLIGRLLKLEALAMKFSELGFQKDDKCPVCGKNPSIKQLIDYEKFCGNNIKTTMNDWEITAEQLKSKIDMNEKFRLIDVREQYESMITNIGGELIPMNNIPARIDDFKKDEEIILYCRTGHRSENAVQYLRKMGFSKAKHLVGGIYSWSDKIDHTVIKY
jgi:molybdopterin/thiamine biosynthesis adenylyltransferase/rhodanese-related sulfurtransferase